MNNIENKKNKFCRIYNEFFEEKLKDPNNLIFKSIQGNDLYRFCEFYFSERLDESELQHFYSVRKSKMIVAGFLIGALVTAAIMAIIFI